ncbi:MAG TPA: TAXI family TRAP transporter solute-binding subunit [Alphaproteobacteria bacterium]
MKRMLFAAGCALAFAAGPVSAQPYNLTLSGASPGGLWSSLGAGVDAAIAAAYPGSTVTYQTSSGGMANIPLVATKKVPLGIAVDAEVVMAQNGQPPFREKITDVRTLARMYSPNARFQAQHVIVTKDFAEKHGLKTLQDLTAKKAPIRIAINRRGNVDGDIAELLLEAVGATPDAIEKWGGQVVRAASREITSLILDRRIDATIYGIAYKHASVLEIARGVPIVLLEIPAAAADKVAKTIGGSVCGFKAGEYDFLSQNINSVCAGAVLIVSKDMDDALAYNLAKGVVSQIEKFKGAHALLKQVTTPATVTEAGPAPFHPGAAKYYKEAGLLK